MQAEFSTKVAENSLLKTHDSVLTEDIILLNARNTVLTADLTASQRSCDKKQQNIASLALAVSGFRLRSGNILLRFGGPLTYFNMSLFWLWYAFIEPTDDGVVLLQSVKDILRAFCKHHGQDPAAGEELAARLDTLVHIKGVDLRCWIQELWSSDLTMLPSANCQIQFCQPLYSIINFALRTDKNNFEMLLPAMQLIRNLNSSCCVARGDARSNLKSGKDFPEGGISYRGTWIPRDYLQMNFIAKINTSFRFSACVASSLKEAKAIFFMELGEKNSGGKVAVMMRIRVDPRGLLHPSFRCQHAHLVELSMFPDEFEYLFAPYSLFTIFSVTNASGSIRDPYIVTLDAALDHVGFAEDQPVSTWA